MRTLIVLLAMLCANSHADTSLTIDGLAKLIATERSEGHFSQEKHISVLSQPLTSHGLYYYKKTEGFLWQTLAPIENAICNSNTNIAETDPLLSNWTTLLFTGDFSGLSDLFEFNVSGEPKQWSIEMLPRSTAVQKAIKSIHVSGSVGIEALTINESSGDFTKIKMAEGDLAKSEESYVAACFTKP